MMVDEPLDSWWKVTADHETGAVGQLIAVKSTGFGRAWMTLEFPLPDGKVERTYRPEHVKRCGNRKPKRPEDHNREVIRR